MLKPNVALSLAVASGLLAVGLVAVDLQFSLTARLETATADGGWRTVAASEDSFGRHDPFPIWGQCGGPTFRLAVDNDKPLPDRVDVRVAYHNVTTGSTVELMRETIRLDAFEEQTFEFTLPADAFPPVPSPDGRPEPGKPQVSAQVDRIFLSMCAQPEVPQ